MGYDNASQHPGIRASTNQDEINWWISNPLHILSSIVRTLDAYIYICMNAWPQGKE